MNQSASAEHTASRTFRDPAGWVELRADGAYRFVHPASQAELLSFLDSPLATDLAKRGSIVPTEILSGQEATHAGTHDGEGLESDGLLVLRHPRVPFISYPWEWCPGQWYAAAELTLNLNRELIPQGWILKDATPLNILFQGSRPVLVDVASVARLHPTDPLWYPYSQFVRTFLLPMLAHTYLGWPLRAALLRRDGWEPEEVYGALSLRQRARQPALSSVTLPALLGKFRPRQAAAAATGPPGSSVGKDPAFVQHVLLQTSAKLLKQMQRAMPRAKVSTWTGYSGTAFHYSKEDHATKRAFVSRALSTARPRRVLDVGANAGVYSRIAVEAGASVVAVDTDLQTLDRLFQQLRPEAEDILPLHIDLANPTPGTGWLNQESSSFLERAEGHFDGVIMLAVIHHLLLHDHIPMPAIAQLAARLTTRTLILEWVPPSDVMFRELVRGRDAIFSGITESAFRAEFGVFFDILEECGLANGRILFHLQSRKAE